MYEQSDLALIGSRIKAVRTGKGMSQADLAVKASTVGLLEKILSASIKNQD